MFNFCTVNWTYMVINLVPTAFCGKKKFVSTMEKNVMFISWTCLNILTKDVKKRTGLSALVFVFFFFNLANNNNLVIILFRRWQFLVPAIS